HTPHHTTHTPHRTAPHPHPHTHTHTHTTTHTHTQTHTHATHKCTRPLTHAHTRTDRERGRERSVYLPPHQHAVLQQVGVMRRLSCPPLGEGHVGAVRPLKQVLGGAVTQPDPQLIRLHWTHTHTHTHTNTQTHTQTHTHAHTHTHTHQQ